MIALVGFMGAGKTTVGRLLAEKAGLEFVDTDDLVEQAAGAKVAEIFAGQGEGRFRTLEREAIARALEGPEAVIALGGGAIHDPVTCSALSWHTVVHLDVTYREAMRRIGHDPGRPMLHLADPRALYDDRHPIYERLADHVVDTSALSPGEATDAILRVTGIKARKGPVRITVDLGPRSYPVLVGEGISADLGVLIDLPAADRAFLISHASLVTSSKPVVDSLEEAGSQVTVLTVDEGEASKQLDVAARLLGELADRGARRSDLIVGFGGGVICDLAGFVSSVYHRGMPVVHVPTTLLAQVDAAIGGKTAVNLAQAKNQVGTVHQPIGVICDVSLLGSLPVEELRSALAEVAKYGFISDPGLLDLVTSQLDAILNRDTAVLTSVVRRCVAIKARVVATDERETGPREVLNYGHTCGHAIEHVTGMRHGEAISIGMMAAANLAESLDMLESEAVSLHHQVLTRVGLPVAGRFEISDALAALKRDKKRRGGIRFVLLEGIGSPRVGVEVSDEQILDALRKVAL